MRYVVLGGGTGSSEVLRSLKNSCEGDDSVTAIITTADNGGHSAIIREQRGTPAFGDIRHAIEALIDDPFWQKTFPYRFPEEKIPTKKEIDGHVVGNYIIAGMYECYVERFIPALLELQRKFGIQERFRVLPVTQGTVDIVGEFANGETVKGETQITMANVQDPKKYPLPITKITQDPHYFKIDDLCRRAICEADIVILGPGSTYTSILAVLAINGVRECLQAVRAKKVIITNIMTQPGETSGTGQNGDAIIFQAGDFVRVIEEFSGIRADYVITNTEKPSDTILTKYSSYGQHFVENDIDKNAYREHGREVLSSELVTTSKDHIRHNPIRLGLAITDIAKRQKKT